MDIDGKECWCLHRVPERKIRPLWRRVRDQFPRKSVSSMTSALPLMDEEAGEEWCAYHQAHNDSLHVNPLTALYHRQWSHRS